MQDCSYTDQSYNSCQCMLGFKPQDLVGWWSIKNYEPWRYPQVRYYCIVKAIKKKIKYNKHLVLIRLDLQNLTNYMQSIPSFIKSLLSRRLLFEGAGLFILLVTVPSRIAWWCLKTLAVVVHDGCWLSQGSIL